MKSDNSLRRLIAAFGGAFVSFCLVAMAIYAKIANVRMNGFLRSGPTALAAAMAGLFGGGLAAVIVLVLLLRWLGDREPR